MKPYVSVDKRSRKDRKEYYSGQRCTWNGFNPATRVEPGKKAYNRKKGKEEMRRISIESGGGPNADFLLWRRG